MPRMTQRLNNRPEKWIYPNQGSGQADVPAAWQLLANLGPMSRGFGVAR